MVITLTPFGILNLVFWLGVAVVCAWKWYRHGATVDAWYVALLALIIAIFVAERMVD